MTKTSLLFKRLIIPMAFIFFSLMVHAKTVSVTSVNALQTAINNASSGDGLILANGRVVKYQTYYQPSNAPFTIFSSNISHLQNGLYHVQIVAGDNVKNIKLIVQN
ncbi:MAG: hypothetical protein QM541_04130 [Flavobacterium sp.]|nr:hypothetical protein [Flavobacterium sp.]